MELTPPVAPAAPVAQPRPRLQRPGLLREIVETIVLIVLVYTFVNLATSRFFIHGPSMQPNFHEEEFLIVSRAHYLLGEPSRGDIVVFDAPGDDARTDNPLLIKRLIGLPGDQIRIENSEVFVNGVKLNESYIAEPEFRCARYCDLVLGANEYFMMGDNRNDSNDSRAFGPVTRDRIVGEAIVRYWPLSAFGLVTHIAYPPQQVAS
jgi:signal peptidase I